MLTLNKTQDCFDDNLDLLFNNLPEVLRAASVAKILGISVKTIYDWRYKRKTRNIPKGLFIKINSNLYLRTAVLRQWITSQNPV